MEVCASPYSSRTQIQDFALRIVERDTGFCVTRFFRAWCQHAAKFSVYGCVMLRLACRSQTFMQRS